MNLKISEEKKLPFKKLDNLFQAIGWKPRGKDKWTKVLKSSPYVVSIWKDNNIIGFGRILEDGVMCMFYDIGVDPEYQKKGIGKQIMERLTEKVKDKNYASIGLFPWIDNKSNIPFYKKFGFVQVTGMELEGLMKRE